MIGRAAQPVRRARELLLAVWRNGGVRPRVVVAVLILAVAVVAGLARVETDTRPESFLPAGDPTLASLNDAARSFGGDPVVVLLSSPKPRQLLGPDQLPKLLALEGKLAGLPDVAVVYGPATVLNQLAARSQNMLASLSGKRDLARTAAMQRTQRAGKSSTEVAAAGKAAIARFDQRYGALLAGGLPAGLPTLRNPRFADHVIFGQGALPKPQWRFVVPAADAASILVRPRAGLDQAGGERLTRAVRSVVHESGLTVRKTTVTGIPAVTAALGERVRQEAPLLGGLAVGLIGACYLGLPWLRRRRGRIVPVLVTLGAMAIVLAVFGWLDRPLSLGLIAFRPILLGIASDYPAYLAHPVRRRRVVVAALAGAAAFASLAFSPMPFVRDLGLALAAGQLVALGLVLLLKARSRPDPDPDPDPDPEPVPARGRWSVRRRVLAAVAALLVAGLGWVALADLGVRSDPSRLAAGLPAVEDARYAERVMQGSGEVGILVRAESVVTPAALDWMRRAQDEIVVRHGSRLRPVVSPPALLAFLGPKPSQAQILAGIDQLPGYLSSAVFRGDYRRAILS
ncbi:MAG: RND transporter, partial [Thermocrispum sp.]